MFSPLSDRTYAFPFRKWYQINFLSFRNNFTRRLIKYTKFWWFAFTLFFLELFNKVCLVNFSLSSSFLTGWKRVSFLLKINVILLTLNHATKGFLKEVKPSAGPANTNWWGSRVYHNRVTELKTSMYRERSFSETIAHWLTLVNITGLSLTRRLLEVCSAASLWVYWWPFGQTFDLILSPQ